MIRQYFIILGGDMLVRKTMNLRGYGAIALKKNLKWVVKWFAGKPIGFDVGAIAGAARKARI